MTAHRSPQPSKVAWDSWKNEIRRLYLGENKPCREIQLLLSEQGFQVSERQIKNRLSEWKFEQKKTPSRHYLAMMTIIAHGRAEGYDPFFMVPKRETRVTYSSQQVKKECERIKRSDKFLDGTLTEPTLLEAQDILNKAGIKYHDRRAILQQRVAWPPHASIEWVLLADRKPGPDRSVFLSTGKQELMTPCEHNCLGNSRACCNRCVPSYPAGLIPTADGHSNALISRQSPASDTDTTMYTPDSTDSQRSWPAFKPEPTSPSCTMPAIEQVHSEYEAPHTISAVRPAIAGPSLSLPLAHGLVHPLNNEIPGIHGLTSVPMVLASTIPHLKAEGDYMDYDTTSFGMVSLEQTEEAYYQAHILDLAHDKHHPGAAPVVDWETDIAMLSCKPEAQVWNQRHVSTYVENKDASKSEDQQRIASLWAAPYYLQSFGELQEDKSGCAKARSAIALEDALTCNNPFILPCLCWTMLIWGPADHTHQLGDLLRASCELIAKSFNLKDSFTYGVPFHYARAWAEDRTEEMEAVGANLQRSRDQIRSLWSENHQNYFVVCFFYAWYLLKQFNQSLTHQALQMLIDILPRCEAVMGPRDLLTVSCLTVISRAHGDAGRMPEAITYLRLAMKRTHELENRKESFPINRPALRRYRLQLLSRHAELCLYYKDIANGERQYWKVLHISGPIYGLLSQETQEAVHELGSIMEKTGRRGEWNQFVQYMQERYTWQTEHALCRKVGRIHPSPPPAPPSWLPY